MRSSIWKKGLICLSAVMLLECPVGALPGTAYTAKAEETDDKTDTSNIKYFADRTGQTGRTVPPAF